MLPAFLLTQQTINQNGESPECDAGSELSVVLVTLGIQTVKEQQSLQLAIQGSVDGVTWRPEPLVTFPQKFYPGVSSVLLDLKRGGEVRYLRAQWKIDRWGRGDKTASFQLYLFAEPF